MRFIGDSNAPSSSGRFVTFSLRVNVNMTALLQIKWPFNSTLQPRNTRDLTNVRDPMCKIEMGKKRKHDSPVVPIDPLGGNTQNFELIVIGKHASQITGLPTTSPAVCVSKDSLSIHSAIDSSTNCLFDAKA
jgi:hypothetical protein